MIGTSNPTYLFAKNRFAKIVGLFVAVVGPLFVGTLAALSGSHEGLLLAGALVAPLMLFLPSSVGLWLLFVVVLLVEGLLLYFARFEQVFWISYLMGLIFMLKIPFEMIGADRQRLVYSRQIPAFLVGLALFFVLFLFSAFLNKTSAFTLLGVSKNYLFVWPLMFLIGIGAVSERSLENLWRFFLWIGMLQFPFAVIERVLFLHTRSGALNWDAIVGTFGGNPEGGGGSGTMAFFLVFAMLLASTLYSARRISGIFHWTVLVCAMATVALAEVKVIFIILPIGYIWLFRKQIPHNLGRTLLMGTLLSIVLAGVFITYEDTFYQASSEQEVTVESTIESMTKSELNPNFYNAETGEVSRTGALIRWWVLNPISNPAQFLFGHGPGASRVSRTLGVGEAARKYPFSLTTSTASVLLWDVGLSGYVTFVFVLLFGAHRAERAARNEAIPGVQRCILQANAATLLLVAMMTIYNLDAINSASTQFLIAAMLGHVLFMVRKYATKSRNLVPVAGASFRASKTPVAVS